MIQVLIDTHRGIQRDNARSGAPNKVLPRYSQIHPMGVPDRPLSVTVRVRAEWGLPVGNRRFSCECPEGLPVTHVPGMVVCVVNVVYKFPGQVSVG